MTEHHLILDKNNIPYIQTTETFKGPVTIYAGPVGGNKEQMHVLGVAADGVKLVSNSEWQPGPAGVFNCVEFTFNADEIEWNPDVLEWEDD